MSSQNPNLDQPLEPVDSAEARMRLALGLGTRPASSAVPAATSGQVPASHDSVRQRRRFAQDGDVPVVMLHRGRDSDAGGENKLAVLSAELREERAARQKAERSLEEANVLVSSLKTKVKHAEMAVEERLLRESESRAQWDASLNIERAARQQAEGKAAEAALALSMLERTIETAARQTPAQPAAAERVAAPAVPDLFDGSDRAPASTGAPPRWMSKKAEGRIPRSAVAASPKPVQDPEHGPETATNEEEDKPIEWWLPSFRAARKPPARRKRGD